MKAGATRLTARLFAAGLAVPLDGAVAFAQGEHGAEAPPSVASLVLPIINFSLFLFVFARYAWPVIKAALADRRQLVEKDLADAERAITEAEAVRRDIEKRRARLGDEGRRITEELRSEAEHDRESLLQAARQSAERIRSDARSLGEQEAARAAHKIREEIAAKVIERVIAGVRERLTDAAQERFVTEFLSGIESGASR